METLPVCSKGTFFAAAIDRVSQQGVADVGHMDPDLVGAPGLQHAAHMGEAPITGDDLPAGDGGTGVLLRHRHALSIGRVAADRPVDRTGIFAEAASDDGLVHTVEAVILQLSGEALVRKIAFRRDQESGGVLVNPVDEYSHPLILCIRSLGNPEM